MCVSCGQMLFVGPVPLSFSPRGTVGPNPFLFFTPISATYPLDGGYKAWASWLKIRPYRWNALLRCNTSSVLFDGFYVGGPNVFFGKQCGIETCQNAGLKHKSFYVSRHGEDRSGVWTLQNVYVIILFIISRCVIKWHTFIKHQMTNININLLLNGLESELIGQCARCRTWLLYFCANDSFLVVQMQNL